LSVFSHRLLPSLENPSAARKGSVGISRKQEAEGEEASWRQWSLGGNSIPSKTTPQKNPKFKEALHFVLLLSSTNKHTIK
jgi:hypothetical protein